ncbi:MAG: phage terminase large subunit [Bosea sp. (in: a-proteobacteria)]|nr:phage terminase large subunit [Bosea sp. (in: a-proteobacteria)]
MVDRTFIEALLRQDFHAFAEKAYATLVPNTPLQRNWHHQALAFHLRQAVEGKIRRLIITLPPRGLKSVYCSMALPAYVLGRWPSRKVVCISYSADLARQFALGSQDIMRTDWYQELFPDTRIRRGNAADSDFSTTKRGGRYATSVGGSLTGRGGNLVIIDDPIKADDIFSDVRREQVIRWFRETVITRLDDKNTDTIVLVMQRLHVDDLAGVLLNEGGWVHLNLPAIAPADEKILIGPERYHLRRAGELLHPDREGQAVLDELKRNLGERAFCAQYLQEPVPPDGTIWQLSWFRTYGHLPERESTDEIIQSWDTAQKSGILNDYSVCTTWLVRSDKRCYLLDVYRARLGFPALRRQVIALAQHWGAQSVCIEDASSGQSLLQDLEQSCAMPSGSTLHAIKASRDKGERAEAASIAIEAGRIHLPAEAPWLALLKKEIRDFPRGHDDQVDSMAQLINFVEKRIIYATDIKVRWPT